eukprot:134875-Chlamydomonas_euryale.AAC.7
MPSQSQAFSWSDPHSSHYDATTRRSHFSGFSLQETSYSVGDCVLLSPQKDGDLPFVGRILGCYADASQVGDLSHCIEVRAPELRIATSFHLVEMIVQALRRCRAFRGT